MLGILILAGVIAYMGHAIATQEQRDAARAAVKRLQWIPISALSAFAAFAALAYVVRYLA